MVYLNRRKLLGVSAAASSMLLSSMKAHANFSGDVQLRDQIGQLERMPTLGLESRENFRTLVRKFVNTDLNRAASRRAMEVFEAAGFDPRAKMTYQQAVELLEGDPLIMDHMYDQSVYRRYGCTPPSFCRSGDHHSYAT